MSERERDLDKWGRERRDLLLFFVGLTGLKATSVELPWVVETSPAKENQKKVVYPQPGWLETNLPPRPPLITLDEGHKSYLRFLSLESPAVKETLRRSFDRVFGGGYSNRPKVGDCFAEHKDDARLSIGKMIGDTDPSTINIVHVAAAAMAARFSPYLSCGEVRSLGVNVPGSGIDDMSIFMHPIYKLSLPYLFPAPLNTCGSEIDREARCLGGDRTVHFSQHFFLTHQAAYLFANNLSDIERIPNGVRMLLKLFPGPELKAKTLDYVAGRGWEVVETWIYFQSGKSDYGRDLDGKKIPSGLVDLHVDKDYLANDLGMKIGLRSFHIKVSENNIRAIVADLNNPMLYREF